MLTKEMVDATMAELPEIFSLDELVERLVLVQKIKIGLAQSERGETVPHEQVKEMLRLWQAK